MSDDVEYLRDIVKRNREFGRDFLETPVELSILEALLAERDSLAALLAEAEVSLLEFTQAFAGAEITQGLQKTKGHKRTVSGFTILRARALLSKLAAHKEQHA